MDGKFSLNDRLILPRLAVHSQNFIFDLQRFNLEVLEAGKEIPEDAIFSCKLKKTNEAGTEVEVTKYSKSADDFTTANLGNATAITLLDNFETTKGDGKETIKKSDGITAIGTTGEEDATIILNPALELSQSCTLDLNGKTLTISNAANGIFVKAAGEGNTRNVLTLTDSSTEKTGKIDHTATNGDKTNGAIKLGYGAKNGTNTPVPLDATDNEGGVGLIMLGGTVTSTKSSAVAAGNNSTITIQDGCTLESRSEGGCGVYFGNNAPSNKEGLDSRLTMTGGTITSNSSMPAIQVSGTMTASRNVPFTATIDISGGKVEFTKATDIYDENKLEPKGDPSAIYASGNTILKISGGEITSTGTGVELKEGSIEVTGGTVKSTAQKYNASPTNTTNNGATSFGAAIAISSREKDKTIDVKISGDNTNISGANALAIANPKSADAAKVTATIDGGNLTSTTSQEGTTRVGNAVLADNANVVITVNNGKLGGNVTVSKVKDTNNNDATIIVNGGITTGDVQVVNIAKTGSGDSATITENKVDFSSASDKDKADAKSALKVTGGRITGTSSANNYVTPGTTVSDNGTVTEIAGANGWSLQTEQTTDNYAYYVGGGTESIITATISGSDAVTNNILRYDKTNKLFGIPNVGSSSSPNFTWVNETENKRMYNLAIYNTEGKAATIKPETSNVKISGTGFIDSTIVTLTAETTPQSLLGVEVDATDNNIAYMKGSYGNDKFIAGDRNTTLDGGEGNDVLEGNSGNDLFLYSAGKDQINNYTYDSDVVSLNGDNLTPPIDFSKATYDGKKIIIDFGSDNKLTLDGASKVAILNPTENGTDTYTYDAKSAGVWNYIAHEGHDISLGAGFTSKNYDGSDKGYGMIDAHLVTVSGGLKISARDDNKGGTVIGAQGGGTLLGGTGNDLLQSSVTAAGSKLTLDGGAYGDDSLVGNAEGDNLFIYRGGADSISGLNVKKDIVRLMGNDYAPGKASVSTVANDLILNFEGKDAISINGGAAADFGAISVQSGTRKGYYLFSKDQISYDKGVTLTSYYDNKDGKAYSTFNGADKDNTNYATINAAANGAISIVGNANNNYIVGGLSGGNSLDGGTTGNDTLVGGTTGSDLFYYTTGKDVIANFKAGDTLSAEDALIETIESGKATSSKLTFTINKKSDVLTFNFGDGDAISSVSTGENSYLTEKGYVKDNALTLFSSAKKTIDLATDTLYSGVSTVDATKVEKQGVTLVGGSGGLYKFNGSNKQKDGFTYGGGSASISGYEGGRDRIDFGTYSYEGFKITSDTDDVVLNLKSGDTTGSISIDGAVGKEVLLRENNKNSKLVFKADGVLENKAKNPTMATVSASYNFATNDNTVKKIFAVGSKAISIQAGNKSNTIINASDMSVKTGTVSLSGGNKNDKLIGATGQADMYIYSAGKDVIQGFGNGDQISLSSVDKFDEKITDAKITKSSSNIKFKFNNKNTLTVKAEKGTTFTNGQLQINGKTYTYLKNAVQNGGTVSLTSSFGGTFKTTDDTQQTIDGGLVKNNLTFVGSTRDEKFIGGGQSSKKTTFKGGGGADTLVGGASKDTFFYAKSYTGDAEIQSFDFDNDKLKVASGKIGNISKKGNNITIGMTNGQKNSSAIVGSFKITSQKAASGTGTADIDTSKVAFKANNTYYWFAKEDDVSSYVSADDGTAITVGQLITKENRLSALPTDLEAGLKASVIDLNYSTNLVKAGVAVKVTEKSST